MLQRIRDRISGWIAGVIIALVAGAFILFGIEFYFEQSAGAQGDVAKVNGFSISQAQLNQAYSNLQHEVMARSGGHVLSSQELQQLKAYALNSLVTQTALFTKLHSDGYRVGMTQVKMMVEEMPDFQVDGKFSQNQFMQAMYGMGISPFAFFQHMQTNLTVQQAVNGVADSAFALPNEVDQFYSLAHQKRAFGYMVLPASHFLSSVKVSEKDIVDYYTQNQKTYRTQPKVSVAYVLLSPTSIGKKINISAEAVRSYYDSHFAKRDAKKMPSFASQKEAITKLLLRQQINKALLAKANQLSDLTYTNPDSLEAASKALNLPIQVTSMMTKAGEKTGVFSNPSVLAAVFSDSVFNMSNNSNVIALPDGGQLVLRIAKKEPSRPVSLKTVHDQIKKELQSKQATAQAGVLAYQLQKKIAAGANPQVLAKQNQLEWHLVPLVSVEHGSQTVPKSIFAAAFEIPVKLKAGQFSGSKALLYNETDYAVVAVSDVKNADPKGLADRQKLSQHISLLWGQLYQHCFVDSILKQSKIKMHSH